MFITPEGVVKKGANTVCNFVWYVIKKEFDPASHKKIVLMSDACGGQNRNYMVLRFFASVAAKLNVEIDYLYPVRGHSFNQCDRNFGLYTTKKKSMERIETQQEYIDIIENARNPPFTIVKENEIKMIDYEKAFHGVVKDVQISKVFLINYLKDGKVNLYEEYYGTPKSVTIKNETLFDDVAANPPPVVGISELKIKDVTKLLRYLKPENQAYYKDHFEKVGKKLAKEETVKKEKIKTTAGSKKKSIKKIKDKKECKKEKAKPAKKSTLKNKESTKSKATLKSKSVAKK